MTEKAKNHRTDSTLHLAAVSCSTNALRLGGVGLGSGSTGKLGHAWVCAWEVVHGYIKISKNIQNVQKMKITFTP